MEQQLRDETDRTKQQREDLEKLLQQATAVVTRNSADLGLEVQRLRDQIQTLEGAIAETRNQSEQTQREFAKLRDEFMATGELPELIQKSGLIKKLENGLAGGNKEINAAAIVKKALGSEDGLTAQSLVEGFRPGSLENEGMPGEARMQDWLERELINLQYAILSESSKQEDKKDLEEARENLEAA